MDAQISVIVPTYNNAKYLKDCLDSIINQTYKNIEIIVIDDGSTDNTQEILEHYCDKERRLRVFYQENQGQGVARNVGISMASGDYIAFVDSDDWLDGHYLETLYKAAKKHDADITAVNFLRFRDGDGTMWFHLRDKNCFEKEYTPQQWFDIEYQKADAMSSVFVVSMMKLFKASLLENVIFPPKKVAEDDYTIWKLYLLANKIVYINSALYIYRDHNDSITAQRWYSSYKAVLERIGILTLLGFDTSQEEGALIRRLNLEGDRNLNLNDYQEYRNAKLEQQLLRRYRH